MSDVGRLFFEGRQFVRRDTSRDQQQEGPLGLQGESQEACLQFVENETEEVFGQQFVFAGDDDDMEENDTFMENDRMVDCICECFEDFCFVDKTFDLNKFSQLSQTLLELSNSQTGCTSENIQSMKAKILSRLTKKMFVTLSLTKTQMDTLNRFIKGVLVFADDGNFSFARKIHAGYLSCLRESNRHVRQTDVFTQNCFDTCEFFSIALDTSRFGQDHVLVCTARFSFQDHLEQFPLFVSVCDASTGEELADYVIYRLKRFNAPLSKLVSIATDGAHNMVGQFNGLATILKRLVQRELGVDTPTFQHVWCLAHRLNLIITDFQNVRNINYVFLFADWFTSKRKAVVYKKWLRTTRPDQRFKKITKPSETRWSFYKVVLETLLTQVDVVEEFLGQDSDFLSFRRKIFPPSTEAGQNQREFFSNRFIMSNFRFALFILEKLWLLNTELQEQYTFLPVVWSSINRMKEVFRQHLCDLHNSRFDNFTYIGTLSENEKKSFCVILEKLLLHMDIRFPCPSTSIDMRRAKRETNLETNTLDRHFLRSVQQHCPLLETVDVFLFPDKLIREREVNEFFVSGRYPEIQRMATEILNNVQSDANWAMINQMSGETDGVRMNQITLLEVFDHVDREQYPMLWRTVKKTLTMFATTVSCEQYFSRLRNKHHENMKKETAFSFVSVSEKRKRFYYTSSDKRRGHEEGYEPQRGI